MEAGEEATGVVVVMVDREGEIDRSARLWRDGGYD